MRETTKEKQGEKSANAGSESSEEEGGRCEGRRRQKNLIVFEAHLLVCLVSVREGVAQRGSDSREHGRRFKEVSEQSLQSVCVSAYFRTSFSSHPCNLCVHLRASLLISTNVTERDRNV